MNEDHLKQMLGMVVEQVVHTGEPVGSQYLVDTYNLKISSATVRNYFAALERAEYITQPHTSSGRIPTEKGFQYYIDNLMKPKLLSKKERNDLQEAAKATHIDERNVKQLAKSAADLAQNAVVIGIGDMDSFYTGLSQLFNQPEFKDWNRIVSMSDILDRMDEVLLTLRQKVYEQPTALIGDQCPFGPMCGSVVISLKQGHIIGVLGPMRMDYAHAISLLTHIQSLLDET
jgi:transcriptional regulator of heat shock response